MKVKIDLTDLSNQQLIDLQQKFYRKIRRNAERFALHIADVDYVIADSDLKPLVSGTLELSEKIKAISKELARPMRQEDYVPFK